MSEELRSKMETQMQALWATDAGKSVKKELRSTAKKKIEEIYKKCLTANLTEMGYSAAQECLREEAKKAGLEKAYEELWGTA